MKGICPVCENQATLEFVVAIEEIMVKGKIHKAEFEYFKCKECGTEFEDPKSTKDPLEEIYKQNEQ